MWQLCTWQYNCVNTNCYLCRALADANSALRIDVTWAKGFYRRGRGLAGLKVSSVCVCVVVCVCSYTHALCTLALCNEYCMVFMYIEI